MYIVYYTICMYTCIYTYVNVHTYMYMYTYLYVHIMSTPDPHNCCLDGFHVNAVAAAVGTFFRELPEPLLTKELYIEFTRTIGIPTEEI